MKNAAVVFISIIVLLLSGCSVQEIVSPLLFIERLSKESDDIVIEYDNCYFDKSSFITFVKYKNNDNITLNIKTNKDGSVNKISVLSNYNNNIFEFIKILINTYSPKEDYERITEELMSNNYNFRYSSGNEYIYSVYLSDITIYFEVINKGLFEYTVPDLTLKPNDKTEF